MQELNVALGERSYPIFIGNKLGEKLLAFLENYQNEKRPIAVITSPNLLKEQASFLEPLKKIAKVFIVTSTDGEKAKSPAELIRVWETLARERIDRTGVIVAVGGGVVGDLTGFAAATFLRGIDFVQVPTTLLSMVDSSVGGKTGINLEAGKNLAGAFYQPKAVFADMQTLETLPPREFAAGMAEVIKYGLLGDADLFEQLETLGEIKWNTPELAQIIARCCQIKAQVVANDERETAKENGRALLNLGHTFGHAIEKVAGYGEYLHGETVAIGSMAIAQLSESLGIAPKNTLRCRCQKIFEKNKLPVKLRSPLPLNKLMQAMSVDKKNRAGTIRFVLMNAIGKSFTENQVPKDLVENIWENLGADLTQN